MENTATKQLKPIDYVKTIFRRKWFIIVPTVIGLVGGLIAGNVLPKVYESSTLMLIEEGKIINPLIQGIAVSTTIAQRTAVLREQIVGWDRLLQLIKSLNLAKDVKNQSQFEALVRKLRGNIIVRLRANNVIGISYRSSDALQSKNVVQTSNAEEGFAPVVNGKQVLKMEASSRGYQPNYFKVKAGIPVRWEITDVGTSGCTNAVISKSLFDGSINLTPGQTSTKEFTPTKPGKYKFSCWMGMISGTIEVII